LIDAFARELDLGDAELEPDLAELIQDNLLEYRGRFVCALHAGVNESMDS
jgi:hypothetical protein